MAQLVTWPVHGQTVSAPRGAYDPGCHFGAQELSQISSKPSLSYTRLSRCLCCIIIIIIIIINVVVVVIITAGTSTGLSRMLCSLTLHNKADGCFPIRR